MEAYSVYTKDGNLEILLTDASTQFYVPQKAKEYHFFTDKKKLFFLFYFHKWHKQCIPIPNIF